MKVIPTQTPPLLQKEGRIEMKGDDGVVVDDIDIHLVTSTESPEFSHFKWAISHSSIIGLDAEWKPVRSHQPTFPPVLLLQIACQLINSEDIVFLLDLSEITLPSIYDLLKDVFISPDILKLGFRFKQDLLYLSSTFREHGCDAGFDTVEPYLDIANIYLLVLHQQQQHKQTRRKPKCNKSLSSICHELLGISLSKELQCSDWSLRPLTDQQKTYAALDALCLIQIFNVFLHRLLNEGAFRNLAKLDNSSFDLGLKQILSENDISTRILRTTYPEAVEMVRATMIEYPQKLHDELGAILRKSSSNSMPMDYTLLQVVREYGDKIVLTESDGKPRTSKKKGKSKSSNGFTVKERRIDYIDQWQGPAPWDSLLGGDGCPKFLCDVMVEGLAKHLRCVGIDAAVPYSKKPETR
ncbi:3'-5' exonuclease domain-containing protein [Artemisia annua]|nr:3'-5' exonuclease domain-containing protein [Artemisia annua]